MKQTRAAADNLSAARRKGPTLANQRSTDEVREAIARATDRLLSGHPQVVGPGELTVVALAREAGVKRHYLTHTHKDMADEFIRRRDEEIRGRKSQQEIALEDQVATLSALVEEIRAERDYWRNLATDYRRVINLNAKSEPRSALTAVGATPDLTIVDLAPGDDR